MACEYNQHQEYMFMKLLMARTWPQDAQITSNSHRKTKLADNRLTETFYSNLGARNKQATSGYNWKEGHGWIENNMDFNN